MRQHTDTLAELCDSKGGRVDAWCLLALVPHYAGASLHWCLQRGGQGGSVYLSLYPPGDIAARVADDTGARAKTWYLLTLAPQTRGTGRKRLSITILAMRR